MKLLGRSANKLYIYIDDLPLLGHIAFGIIDRGTTILQVRPTTICPLNCIFCSVDAGPRSRYRQSEYIVDPRHMVTWFRYVVKAKDNNVVEALIDGVGDPATYPYLPELVRELKRIVPRVAMETHGATLTKELVRKLEEAGLDRINLSIDTLDTDKARYLQGTKWINISRVKEIAEFIAMETSIDLHITPVWISGVNDQDIEQIIEWGLRIGAGKRFPPFGIQKYEVHKYGRKIPGVKEVSWYEFRKYLESLERKYGVPLYYKKLDFGIRKTKRVPIKYRVGEELLVQIAAPGWLRGELIAVDRDWECVITVIGIDVDSAKVIGRRLRVKIVENKDGIYIAKPLGSLQR